MRQQLFKDIFGREPQDSHEFLMETVETYPYFNAAHYFLLAQTKPDEPAYPAIAAMAGRYFHNSLLLAHNINKVHNPIVEKKPVMLTETPQINDGEPAETKERKVEDNPAPSNDEPLVFEPLYTTDYFASQGIRLSEEMKANDKLGKQLRSFTDWLKTMKKVHGELPPGNEQTDKAVQHIAEKSNVEDEVVTESMAEVFVEQGKYGRALDIYTKLSLIYPAKSAYFAAKIESLKEN